LVFTFSSKQRDRSDRNLHKSFVLADRPIYLSNEENKHNEATFPRCPVLPDTRSPLQQTTNAVERRFLRTHIPLFCSIRLFDDPEKGAVASYGQIHDQRLAK
jgi:hypothetical protein